MMDHDRVPRADRQLLLSYYGDDFTGSTDVMEVLELAGIPTALYLRPPSPVDIADHPTVRAVGLAGASRTWSIEQMDADLPSVFRAMSGLGALTFHYKICSTFDSSPAIGSIGRALEIGQRSVSPAPIPLLVGSPDLGRYCVFGELYARAGRIHRLDRHPTLPVHPVTPMREADLLRHLRLQTDLPATDIDVLTLDGPTDARISRYHDARRDAAVILFDVLSVEHLERIGELLWSGSVGPAPFMVGSSGIESALVAHWRQQGWLDAPPARPGAPEAPFQLVLSGSCSMATMAQVEYARERGYVLIRLPSDAAGPGSGSVEHIADEALKALDRGQSAVVFSALGPAECDDATIAAGVGEALAEVGARIVARARPPRLVVAGGDTSGRVATRLGIDSLRFLAPIAPGAPLCRARSRDPRTDGLEVCLKGGQIGGAAYFEQVRMGRA